jgi:RNA polymerase sigma-70 factor (ECF subfamily)
VSNDADPAMTRSARSEGRLEVAATDAAEVETETASATLTRLLAQIADGDANALDQLRLQVTGRLYSIAFRILGSAEDAEEIVVDVLLWLWQHADRFAPERGHALAWLGTLTWNRAIDALRQRQRRQSILHPDPAADTYVSTDCEAEGPAEWLQSFDRSSDIATALAALRATQRELILLAFFEGLSHAEIAERLQRPLGSVKSDIRRGLQRLHQLLRFHAPEGKEAQGG